ASLHAKATRGQHREALTLVKEALFFPALLPEEIEKARKEQLSALSNLEEDNLEFIKQEFYARLFSGHPYGRPVLGTRETIHAIAPAEVREFHRTHFTADRVVVAVTGPVQPRQVASFIAGRWGDLPRGPGAALASLDPPAQLPHGDQLVKRNRTQWTINFGWPTVAYRDPRRVSVSVLLSMIQHRHFFKYVYQEGVSYRSWFSGWDHRGTGVWIVENDVDRNRFDEIVGKIENDIREYAAGPFTADELTRAKSRMQNSLLLDRQSSLRDTWGLAVAEGNGIGFEEYVRRPAAIDRVSLQMARGLARELFGPGNYLRLVMK
ncbi:MAG: insulinase family protein, partial [candidate division NC10 bacterium]|nr:insulinase family protein [candidate division NC10 bacterium]